MTALLASVALPTIAVAPGVAAEEPRTRQGADAAGHPGDRR